MSSIIDRKSRDILDHRIFKISESKLKIFKLSKLPLKSKILNSCPKKTQISIRKVSNRVLIILILEHHKISSRNIIHLSSPTEIKDDLYERNCKTPIQTIKTSSTVSESKIRTGHRPDPSVGWSTVDRPPNPNTELKVQLYNQSFKSH